MGEERNGEDRSLERIGPSEAHDEQAKQRQASGSYSGDNGKEEGRGMGSGRGLQS